MDEKKTHLIGEDVKTLPLKELLKRIGPGLIATGIVIGPGAVTTAAMLGANYGYALIWLVFPIIFMGITFVMTTNWLAITTGMPTIHAIRKYYGKAGAGVVGVALFLACLFFTMGNISGSGAGMNLIFGINWKIGSLLLIAVVVYTYFAKNVYSKVEKLITACIIVMILAFYITLFGAGHGSADNGVVGFEGGKFVKGLFGFSFPEGSLGTALAFISTNAAITTGIYNTYLGKEKKWKKEDLFNGVMLTDALVIMGPAAKYIMGFALVGAGFSSLLANTQRGMVLLGAGIEKEFGLESKFIRYGCLACLAFAMAICYSFNGSPTQLILIANIATSIATPIGGLFVLLLIWRKDVNEGYKAPTALRICMTISYVFVLIMTVSAFQKTIIPGIMKLFA